MLDLLVAAHMLGGVGFFMVPPSQASGPPVATFALITEDGAKITTEAGVPLRTETDTP